MQTTIASVLNHKGHEVWSVPPTALVSEAIQVMAQHRIVVLLVLSDDQLVGIISERDCTRKVILPGRSPDKVRVGDAMTSPVVFVSPAHTVGDCMWIMTDKGFTHLPVVDGGRVVGVVSSGDLLRSIVKTQSETINHLEGYISGKYPG
ncbi:CBS domain-containing protein [Luteitalea sp.]|uniref:CBS domain-containing protein n=1 Tax=Luteitalea sp. TaxID=2004800 RepID=UPI0025C04315|nr:CBS domain-containing protein [Luteitalea sp.]